MAVAYVSGVRSRPRLILTLALLLGALAAAPAGAETPLYRQEREDSCGPACLRMMIDSVRSERHSEEQIRQVCRTVPGGYGHPQRTEAGMDATAMPEVLRRFGVPSRLVTGALGYAALQQHTPAIVRLKMSGGGGHFVLVERATCVGADRLPSWQMEIYDPDPGQRYTLPGHIFASCYGDYCVWRGGEGQASGQPGQARGLGSGAGTGRGAGAGTGRGPRSVVRPVPPARPAHVSLAGRAPRARR